MTARHLCFAGLFAFLLASFALIAAAQAPKESYDLSGNWKTRFGPVTFTQDGVKVRARFQWGEAGEFTGRIEGVWLTGRWNTASGSSAGTWRLEIMPGGNRLSGNSTPDGGGEIRNFSAVRAELLTQRPSRDIAPAESAGSDEDLSGSWTASLGQFTLRQQGDLLTGLFDWDGGGRITGRREGNELRGEWHARNSTNDGQWQARLTEKGRLLAGKWIAGNGDVRDWTARREDAIEESRDSGQSSSESDSQDQKFTGEWRSRFGRFRLTEAMGFVTGRFEWNGGGTFTGSVFENVASGKWVSGDGSRAGTWMLRSLPGGRILQGTFTTTQPEQSTENWTAIRAE